MTKNNLKKGKQKKTKVVPKKGKKQQPRQNTIGLDNHARSYLRLLSDPCSADLTSSLYEGSGAAYQIRLNQIVSASLISTGFTAGQHYKVDVLVCFIPGSRVLGIYTVAAGANFGSVTTNTLFSFLATGTVQSYRCIAACLKFQPNGEYSYRSGTIGSYPETNLSAPPAGGFSAVTIQSKAIDIVSVGSEAHEVVWCPTSHDGNLKTNVGNFDDSIVTGGVISMILSNVDGIATSSTNVVVQGTFNMTAAYEWIPESNSTGVGIPSNIASVPRTPMNVALSTLGNMSKWATHGYKAYKSPMGQAAYGLLTGGVQPNIQRSLQAMRIGL